MTRRDDGFQSMANLYDEPRHEYEDDPEEAPAHVIDDKTADMFIDGQELVG